MQRPRPLRADERSLPEDRVLLVQGLASSMLFDQATALAAQISAA